MTNRGQFQQVALATAALPLLPHVNAKETAVATSPTPTDDQIHKHLRLANEIAQQAVEAGHHPFGAVLVAGDNETVLMTQGNLSTVQHAESELARCAFEEWGPDALWPCTLYSTVEPCAMCAGTQYWANIGRLVYGIGERDLLAMTGDHEANPTMDVPSRFVFEHSQKVVEVIGPILALKEEIAALHRDFWK